VKMFIAKKPEIRVFYVTNKVPRFQWRFYEQSYTISHITPLLSLSGN
jgi:hypothetical protein